MARIALTKRLEAKLEIAKKALQFYANGEHMYNPNDYCGWDEPHKPLEIEDQGETATKALSEMEGI